MQRQEGDDGYHRGQCCQAAKAIPTAVILPFHRRDLLLEGNGILFPDEARGGCTQAVGKSCKLTLSIRLSLAFRAQLAQPFRQCASRYCLRATSLYRGTIFSRIRLHYKIWVTV